MPCAVDLQRAGVLCGGPVEGIEQPQRQLIHLARSRSRGHQSAVKAVRLQRIQHVFAFADHVHRNIPRRALTADVRRRLMVAENDQDEIIVGARTQVAREHVEEVLHRARVARSHIGPVGPLREGALQRRGVVGLVPTACAASWAAPAVSAEKECACSRSERTRTAACADGAVPRAGRAPPPHTDRVYATIRIPGRDNPAWRNHRCRRSRRRRLPASLAHARHHRDGPVARRFEHGHERRSLLRHQQLIAGEIAHLDTRKQAQMRQHRLAPEGRRGDKPPTRRRGRCPAVRRQAARVPAAAPARTRADRR